jgi:hypothetical protein
LGLTGKDLTETSLDCVLPGIDVDLAMQRVMGKRKVFVRMLGSFHDHYSPSSDQLAHWLQTANEEDLRAWLHGFIGSSGTLAAVDLFELAKKLHQDVHEQRGISVVDAQHLQHGLSELLAAIPSYLGRELSGHGGIEMPTPAQMTELLSSLLASLAAGQFIPAMTIVDLQMYANAQPQQDERLLLLVKKIESLDYKQARIITESILASDQFKDALDAH